MLKRSFSEEGAYELEIHQLFSSPELADDPRNHCAPRLDVIELQDHESPKIKNRGILTSARFQSYPISNLR